MTRNVVSYSDIKSADSCRYDGVSLGEVMLRLDPFDVPTARANCMHIFQGGCGDSFTSGVLAAILKGHDLYTAV